jgi:predicted small secreted protein
VRGRTAFQAAVAALVLAATSAPATETVGGVGADVWTAGNVSALLSVTADQLWTVLPQLELGVRTGLFFVTSGSLGTYTGGIPLDGQVRFVSSHFYWDGLVGPWLFFSGTVARLHLGMGFGVQSGPLRAGAEVAYLYPGAQFGVRIAFTF